MGSTLAHDKRSKQKRQKDFLAQLEIVAAVTKACKKSKVPRRTVYDWIKDDPIFKVAFDASCKIAVAALEDEAIRRAHEGTVKPVFQGGKIVGKIREYSDTLLIFLLKGRAPEIYRDSWKGTLSNPDGSPLLSELKLTIQHSPVPIANSEDDVDINKS